MGSTSSRATAAGSRITIDTQIDLQATALSGLAVIVALIVAWLVATARGQSGSPYGWLMAIAGLTYVFAVGWFRWRG